MFLQRKKVLTMHATKAPRSVSGLVCPLTPQSIYQWNLTIRESLLTFISFSCHKKAQSNQVCSLTHFLSLNLKPVGFKTRENQMQLVSQSESRQQMTLCSDWLV